MKDNQSTEGKETIENKVSSYTSKQDWRSRKFMMDTFLKKDNLVWFVEHIESQKWIGVEGLTNDPLQALQFDTEPIALSYIIKNKLGVGYKPTQHEFVG